MSYGNQGYSIKSILAIALPLMVSALGYTLMITCDRIMLAHHDINEMNAVVTIGILLFTFECAISGITVTSEIFSGQYNGLKKKEKTPVATWQMLGMSAVSIFFFVPIGLFAGRYIIPQEFYNHGKDFFKIIMCVLALAPANSAINGFFIGIKKPSIILRATIISNLLNIGLSYIFIFGIDNMIEPMGAKGAAIATSFAMSLQFCILFGSFLSKKLHNEYQTRNFSLDKEIFASCLKLGIPSSVGLIAEMLGNYAMQILIVLFLPEFVTNHSIALNIYVFLTFLLNGIHKATSGLTANLIGASRIKSIDSLLFSVLKIHVTYSIPILLTVIFYGSKIAGIYSNDPVIIENTINTLPWMVCVFFFEGVGWIISAALIAGGDTKFNMYINIFGIWVLRFLPLYYILNNGAVYVSIGWVISSIGNIIYALLCYMRYRSNKWLILRVS